MLLKPYVLEVKYRFFHYVLGVSSVSKIKQVTCLSTFLVCLYGQKITICTRYLYELHLSGDGDNVVYGSLAQLIPIIPSLIL